MIILHRNYSKRSLQQLRKISSKLSGQPFVIFHILNNHIKNQLHNARYFFNSLTKYIIMKNHTAAGNSISEKKSIILLDKILGEFSWSIAKKT